MPITQQSFFGCSIRNFSCSIGWGSQSSTLTVNLVEDPARNEQFLPNLPGQPGYFTYDNFAFGGIVQNYKRKNSTSGYPVFEVTIVDPRDILEGVQIIIDGFTGSIGDMPNLFNVYGYLENIQFGNAEVNENGILTSKLLQGIGALIGIGIGSSPINYFGVNYYLDMTAMPLLPDYHRIGGGVSLSLMDIINRLCEDGGADYFVTLYQGQAGENIIKVHTVSRVTQPEFGKINDFINANTTGEAVQNEVGLELRNEVVGKFIVGGNQAAMYFQTYAEGDDETFRDDTICQFWGLDANGAPIIQRIYQDDNPRFTLDSRLVNVVGVGATYESDVEEMRAALGGQVSWQIFIESKKDVAGSPHQNKSQAFGLPAQKTLADILNNVPADTGQNEILNYFKDKIQLSDLAPLTGRIINRFDRADFHQENITLLYQYVQEFANTYYGRQYMVRISDIEAKLESDTDRIITNIEPTDGGYIPENQYAQAIGNGLMPTDFTRVSLEDGRLQAYVRFNNENQDLIFDEISPDDIILDGNFVYVKCTVKPTIYVLNLRTLESPRVIVELPGRVYRAEKNDFKGALKIILERKFIEQGLPAAEHGAVFNALLTRMGADDLMKGSAGLAVMPDLFAIPLKSNVATYGPWYSYGARGKIEFEQISELVPWNYGGFEAMNNVANALISAAIAGQIRGETGSITVPDGPNYNIGSELVAGGPYITSVNVEVGENGVTSTYRMETWTPRFGKLAKLYAERMSKLARENAARRREMRRLGKLPPPNHPFFKIRANAIQNLGADVPNTGKTSATYIGGQIHKVPNEDTYHNDMAIMPEYNALPALSNEYDKKAFMSLDGLFRPFSTKKTDTGVPHYEEPEEGAEQTVDDLDPFKQGNDIRIVSRDTQLQNDQHIKDMTSPDQRPIALRGPLVIAGWGLDTNGKPVPNYDETNPTDEYLTGYLERSDKWKVGPVDLRWDNSRKVWAAGLGVNIRVIKLAQNLQYGGTASGTLQDLSWDGTAGSAIQLVETSGVVIVGELPGYNYYDVTAVTEGKYVVAIQSNEYPNLYILHSAFLE